MNLRYFVFIVTGCAPEFTAKRGLGSGFFASSWEVFRSAFAAKVGPDASLMLGLTTRTAAPVFLLIAAALAAAPDGC